MLMILLLVSSCREELSFDLEGQYVPSVSLSSSIAPDKPIEVTVLKNSPISNSLPFEPMIEAEIWLQGNRLPGGKVRMIYNQQDQRYRMPLDAFRASGALLRATPEPRSMRSVAVVAYGRDHAARIDVREIGFY